MYSSRCSVGCAGAAVQNRRAIPRAHVFGQAAHAVLRGRPERWVGSAGRRAWLCAALTSCLLCSPLPPCSDTAVLLDKVGQAEAAVDYATGALVNAQVGHGAWLGCWGAACGNAVGTA